MATPSHTSLAARPNVIWVFGDQHRAQAMGYAGDPNLHTPNIDSFAAQSAVLDGISGCPLCCPYRGSLLTGLYPHHCVPGHEHAMPQGQATIAHAFNQADYETAWFGKWHVDGFAERTGRAAFHTVPPDRRGGFDTWIGFENNNSQYDCHVHGHQADGNEVEHYRLRGYETDALTDLLLDFIDGHKAGGDSGSGRPFFAALSVQPPHNPYIADERWMARHTPGEIKLRPNVPDIARVTQVARRELAGYYAMIENIDWNFGRLRRAIEAAGLRDDTYIIFFSDHGDMHGSHGQFRKTCPMEESVRVPMVIGGGRPYYEHRAGRKNVLVNHVDIGPTSLGLCGIEVPDQMQGTDYSSVYRPDRPQFEMPDSAFLQLVIPTGHGDSTDRPWRGVVTNDGWKYVCLQGQPWLMFNLNEDPYEQANLAHNTRFGAQRGRLHDRLAQWIADTGDEFTLPEL